MMSHWMSIHCLLTWLLMESFRTRDLPKTVVGIHPGYVVGSTNVYQEAD